MISKNFSSFYFAFFLLPFLFQSIHGATQNKTNGAPNIVILFADDLGYGDLGAFGHPTIHTPNLDRMAAEGMKLTQFYVPATVCTPSRAALVTGRYPVRSGMCSDQRAVLFPDSEGGLPASELTIAEILKEQGYATACLGKWHLGHLPPYLPTRHGFDYYFGIPYSNDMSPRQNDWEGAQKFPEIPLMEGEKVIDNEPDQGLLTRRYTEKAIGFMRENQDQPFFVYLPYTFPHVPLYASPEFKGASRRGLYGDVVEEIDWSVGEIMSFLKTNGLAENTLVLFTSDNGPWLVMQNRGGSAGLFHEGKGTAWEGGVREPALAWWPGVIPAGSVSMALASTLDFLPTAAALAGAELPKGHVLDGYNLMPQLKQEKESVREAMFIYLGQTLYAVRKGPWKMHFVTMSKRYQPDKRVVKTHDPPLLFNVEEDPGEQHNLAEEHPDIITELTRLAEQHLNSIDAPPTLLNARIGE